MNNEPQEEATHLGEEFYVPEQTKEEKVDKFNQTLSGLTSPEETLQFLIENRWLEEHEEFKKAFFSLLKGKPAFRKYFCEHPSSFLLEVVLFNYCSRNPKDTEMQTVKAEYETAQHSRSGMQKRNLYFTEQLRKSYEFPEHPKALSEKQEDLIRVALFLMDHQRVGKCLKELETLIEEKARREDKLEANETKDQSRMQFKGYKEGEPYKHRKFLFNVLEKLGKQLGFGNPTKVSGVLDDKTFFQMFQDKRLFKDKAFGGFVHGEWTHFIQWICIALEHARNPFLHCHPPELYQWLGTQPGSLWNKSFETDDIPLGVPELDARNVETFDSYLRGSEASSLYPLLQQLLQGRAERRQWVKKISSEAMILKELCGHYSNDQAVKELKAILDEKATEERIAKNFVDHFIKHKKEYPDDFAKAVVKKISPR